MTIEDGFWLFFPEGLWDYFDMEGHREFKDEKSGGLVWEFLFEEKNHLPEGFSTSDYEAKDFVEKRILDLPILCGVVELLIRRCRWRQKSTGETLHRDLSFLAKGRVGEKMHNSILPKPTPKPPIPPEFPPIFLGFS